MKIFLAGHEGSKKILAASSYLIAKYLTTKFDIHFLNFGDYDEPLFAGRYVQLDDVQHGGSESWARYLAKFFELVPDEFIIFALDDYLLSGPMDMDVYQATLQRMKHDETIVAGRLCQSDFYEDDEKENHGIDFIRLTRHANYSSTTQYTIWRREFLIKLLGVVSTPWQFELSGSQWLNYMGGFVIGSKKPAMQYPDASCLSSKWAGVRIVGNKPDDIEELIKHGHLKEKELLRC